MKETILVMALLISSIFAGMFVLADETSTTIENIDDAAVAGVSSTDIGSAVQDIKELQKHKRVGFVKITRGNGWIENGQEGTLINGFWVAQRFAKIDNASNKTAIVKGFGKLHVDKGGNYKLVIANENDVSENETKVSFNLIPLGDEYESTEEATGSSVGQIVLTRELGLKGLKTWKGTLTLNDGRLAGSWNVVLATDSKTINHQKVAKIKADRQGNADATRNDSVAGTEPPKRGFWQKVQFWKKQKDIVADNSQNAE
ncbi:MAG: hypothetical protein AABX88_01405 [Nanoarchaeota archaeon]